MIRPIKIFLFYLLSIIFFYLILNWLKLLFFSIPIGGYTIEVSSMMLITVIGGIISLSLTISRRALTVFLIIYGLLWLFRTILLSIGSSLGEVKLLGRVFHFDLIIPNYYHTVSKLQTPLPFVIFWFINYLFSTGKKIKQQREETT
jgi:hypothetical protein